MHSPSCPDRAGAILPAHGLRRLNRGHRGQDFGFLRADRGGVEARGRLHRHHRQQCEGMVRHHIAQRARRLVKFAALLHAHRFGDGDLNMIDAVAIPDRFEQPIGEAQRHDALDRVFSQKMIDAENLVLAQCAQDVSVERTRRIQAVAERLFNHHAPPIAMLAVLVLVLIGQPGIGQMLHHRAEETPGDGEIEDDIAPRVMALFRLAQFAADRVIEFRLRQIAANIRHFLRKPLPHRFVDAHAGGLADKIFQHVVKTITPAFGGSFRQIDTDQREILRQHFRARQIIKCRHQQAPCHVAIGAEDHHHAGIGRAWLTRRGCDWHCGRLVGLHGAISARGRWVLRPRHGRRNRSASPKVFSRRMCVPCASGSGRKVLW